MSFKRLCCAMLIGFLGASSAHAASTPINIDVPLGAYSNPLKFGPMSITSSGDRTPGPLEVLDANPLSGTEPFVCGSFQFGGCGADVFLTFDTPISSLSFDVVQTSTSDNFAVLAYSDPNATLGQDTPDFFTDWDSSADSNPGYGGARRLIELDAGIDFTRVYIVNSVDYAAFGNFSYVSAAPIPLPAGVWFGLTGVMALATMKRQRPRSV